MTTEELDLPPRAEGGIDVVVETPDGRATQRLFRAKDRDVTQLLMKQDVWRWFERSLREGDVFFLEALTEGEQPTFRISIPPAKVEASKLANLEVVAVRPDWTDHRGLLGYFNPITEQYSTTPFLELLLRAAADCRQAEADGRPPHAFFALLDEMNLARVEHYFADFLSALESGEPLHLHDSPDAADGETTSGTSVPMRLPIPPNVFFIGTVNVDESTYMFSPKVIDRAFTLEFDDVDLGARGADAEECELRLTALPDSIVPRRGPAPEDWSTLQEEHEGLAKVVQGMHAILVEDRRHFGYRVANEIARYVLLAIEQAGVEAGDVALDLALLHKVLPKLHGSQHELEPLIDRLLAFAILGDQPSDKDIERLRNDASLSLQKGRLVRMAPDADDEDQPRLPRVAGKLFRMRARLLRQGFTSFIE